MGTSDTVMFMQKTKRDCECDLHVTGKYIPDKTHNLVRDGVEFEIEGLAKDAQLRRHPTQNEMYQFIASNPYCHQKTIVNALSIDKGNVSRDIGKLIAAEHISGDAIRGYVVRQHGDNHDDSNNLL